MRAVSYGCIMFLAMACDGSVGATGPQGVPGPQGVAGPQGVEGPQGERGPEGAPGVQGEAGAPGAPGVPGSQGEQGEQGESGVVEVLFAAGENTDETPLDDGVRFWVEDCHTEPWLAGPGETAVVHANLSLRLQGSAQSYANIRYEMDGSEHALPGGLLAEVREQVIPLVGVLELEEGRTYSFAPQASVQGPSHVRSYAFCHTLVEIHRAP